MNTTNDDDQSENQLYFAGQVQLIIRSFGKNHPAQAKIKAYHDECFANDGFVDNEELYRLARQLAKTDAEIAAELELDQLISDLEIFNAERKT